MPNSFTIFGLEIAFYGLLIAFGFLFGTMLIGYFAKIKGYHKDLPYDLVLILFPLAIIGARLYYVAFSGTAWTFAEILAIQNGGLAIYGGIIGGFLGLLVYAKIKKINIIKLTDIVVPSLILGQAIGRWGNFFNQEAYGTAVTNPSFQWFPFAVFIEAENTWHLATFFYESMFAFIGFFLLTALFLKTRKNGYVTGAYFIFYGIVRAVIEGFRTDSLYIGASNIRVSQVLSIILVLLGAGIVAYYHKKQNTKNSRSSLDAKL